MFGPNLVCRKSYELANRAKAEARQFDFGTDWEEDLEPESTPLQPPLVSGVCTGFLCSFLCLLLQISPVQECDGTFF